MARSDPQVNVRLPAELKQRLDELAAASGRSLTAEIVLRLQQSLAQEPPALTNTERLELEVKLDRAQNAQAAARAEIHNLHFRLELLRMRERQAASEDEKMIALKEMRDIEHRLVHAHHEEQAATQYVAQVAQELAKGRR
jgi:predicted transcriptional regulator